MDTEVSVHLGRSVTVSRLLCVFRVRENGQLVAGWITLEQLSYFNIDFCSPVEEITKHNTMI